MSAAVRADLYWCESPEDGKPAALTSSVIEGVDCRLVQKDEDKPAANGQQQQPPAEQPAATPRTETENERRIRREQNTSAPATAPPAYDGYPKVWPKEQAERDQLRYAILQHELELEIKQRNLIGKQLNTRTGSLDDPVLVRYFQRRLDTHVQNIKALRQEIARLQ